MGGRGANSGTNTKVSSLQAFKENGRQFNAARQNANTVKASILEYKDITGKTIKRYLNGATFVDRKSALYDKEHNGVYKASFKIPKEWKIK